MKEKNSLLIKFIIITFVFSFLITGVIYMSATKVSIVDMSEFIKVETSDLVRFKVKDVSSDTFGNINIKVLAMNSNIKYEFHNWTLGDGEGNYKNFQIAVVQDGKCYLAKTYPFGVVLDEQDFEEGFYEGDGISCSMRNFKLEDEYQIAVVYSDRENQQYVVYQE